MSHYTDSFQHAKPRFQDSAIRQVDPLIKNAHLSYKSSVYPVIRYISSQTSATLGQTVIYQLPQSGYISELVIQNDFAQTTTADNIPYVGACCIDRIVIRCGSETIHDYSYVDALTYYLKQMESEETITQVMEAAGGAACDTTAAAITNLCAPVPWAFSAMMGCDPLALHKLSDRVEVEVTYKSASDITLASGSGSAISNSQIICYMSNASDNLKREHFNEAMAIKSFDIRTFKSTAISTATQTSLDISGFPGLIKWLSVRSSLSADIDSSTPINYFNLQAIDTLVTSVDGDEETVFQDARQGEITSILFNQGKPQSSTLGYTYAVPLSLHTFESKKGHVHNVGGLHSSKVNKFELKVTQSTGADCEVGVTAIIAALYQYKAGGLKRLL